MATLIGKIFGRYEVRSKLGEGGMGEVYTAHDPELGRSVALKVLSAEFSSDTDRKNRFRQEARAASALNHPNIITIYEIGENENGSFIVTELIEGKTLREIIRSEPLPMVRTLKIIEQTANALVAAHTAKIAHRDIKPENIMVRDDGIVKVLDFGLAKPNPTGGETGENDDEAVKTIPGVVMGSARYMSPEQARGLAVDERSDIWSLGVVLYEMAAGKPPFAGTSTGDTIAAVIYKEQEPLTNFVPNAPPELVRIIRKSLQKDREERYQSVKDFALDIKDLLFELEHQNSAERAHTSDFELSENPTMIHQTVSVPTNTNAVATSDISLPQIEVQVKPRRWPIAAGLGGAALVAILAFGGFRYFRTETNLAATAFEKPQVSRINTDGKVAFPAISPDGRYLAYVSGESGNRTLVVRQISTDSVVKVAEPTNLNFNAVSFSPTGDYIYYTLTGKDFSVNTLYQVPTLGGQPKKIVEDVDSPVTFSPDGKKFAFMRHVSSTSEDVYIITDATTLAMEQLVSSKDAKFDFFSSRPAWSPDGKKLLASAGKREGGFVSETVIGEISIAERTFKPLTNQKWVTASNFVWFADGSGFLFAGREQATAPAQIFRSSYPNIDIKPVTNDFNDYNEIGLSSDGKSIITLKGEASSSIWRFSPSTKEGVQIVPDSRNLDGISGLLQLPDTQLAYTRNDGKEIRLWAADADGKNAHSLQGDSEDLAYSPVATRDGHYIVFCLQKKKSARIWRMDADGKNPIQLTEEDPNQSDFNPQLTADGKAVVFQRQTTSWDRALLMKVSIDGGPATPFYSNDNWNVTAPKISPDGKKIVFGAYDVNTFVKKLKLASIDGDTMGPVEKDFDFNLIGGYRWAPDGKSLTISTSRDGVPNILRMPLDGTAAQPITDFKSGQIFNFSWSNDGKSLFIVRGTVNNDLILIRDAGQNTSR